jgi:putative ABC transport system permease protein
MHFAEIRESLWMALNAIASHKLRSALTLVGVMIGVFSIIVVMTAMRVLQANIEREMSGLGSQTFQVQKWPGAYFGGPEGFEKFWRRPQITLAQGQRVADRATLARSVGLEENFWVGEASSRFANSPPGVQLIGATPGIFPARNWIVAEGRAINQGDIDSARDICILGAGLARSLFPQGSAIGERVKLGGLNYTVVGRLESRGQSLGGNQDNFAVIPLSIGLNRFGRYRRNISILVQARSPATFEDSMEEVRGILRAARKVPPGAEDDFEIFSNDSLITQFRSFTVTVRVGMAVVSSIALLAAGIGIMNIMLISVTERTREIGVRRAVGAKRRNILLQFVLEAIVLCELGGIVGIILGILAGNATAVALEVPPAVPVDWIVLGLVICSVVGIIFGTYPAYKAAHLDPIDSLRYE